MRSSALIVILACATAAAAQTPPSWGTRDPLALPGDNLPPPMSAVLSPPPPPNPNMPRPVIASPSLALALEAAQAAIARCKADGFAVGVAVSNSVGGMILGMQADGAFPGRTFYAARKNLVSIEFGMPSLAVREKVRGGDFATLARIKPNMALLGGALPLFADGQLIGALAVSGAPGGDKDEVCAVVGAAVFGGKP